MDVTYRHDVETSTFTYTFDETTEFELNILGTYSLYIDNDGSIYPNDVAWTSVQEDARASEESRDNDTRAFLCENYPTELCDIYKMAYNIARTNERFDADTFFTIDNLDEDTASYIRRTIAPYKEMQ